MLFRLFRSSSIRVVAQGPRLRLRSMTRPDLATVARWFAEPEIVRLAFGSDLHGAALRVMADDYVREMDAARHVMLTVETMSARMIGFVRHSLFSPERGRTARVGIVLGEPEFWGRGYGTEALSLFLDHLFSQRSVHWIELDTAHFNTRAQRCFARCGFSVTAVDPLPTEPGAEAWATPKVWMELSRDTWHRVRSGLLEQVRGVV